MRIARSSNSTKTLAGERIVFSKNILKSDAEPSSDT
jgi:hypothetical protein